MHARAEPVARNVLRFPLVVEAQTGSSLREDEVGPWQAVASEVARPAPQRVEPPAHPDPADRVEDVILRRGSTRVFRLEAAPLALLAWGLAAAARAAPSDSSPAGTLLEHYVNVHDIPGLDPGGYLYRGGTNYEGRSRSGDRPRLRRPAVPRSASWGGLGVHRFSRRAPRVRSPPDSVGGAIEPPCWKPAWFPVVWRSTPSPSVAGRPD